MKGFQEGVSPTSGRQSQNKEGRPATFPEGLCKLSVGVPVQSRAPQQAEGEKGMAEEAVGRGHDSGQPSCHQIFTRVQHRRIRSTVGGSIITSGA